MHPLILDASWLPTYSLFSLMLKFEADHYSSNFQDNSMSFPGLLMTKMIFYYFPQARNYTEKFKTYHLD